MSKAFVKETEDEPEPAIEAPALPAGLKNYMTAEGHRRMQQELQRLIREERPTKGKIFVDGVELGRMRRGKLPHYRRTVGLVFHSASVTVSPKPSRIDFCSTAAE